MPYTYEIFDVIILGAVLTTAVIYLARKGELFRNW